MNYNEFVDFEEINTGGFHKDSKLVVWCQTYNHEKYIKDALNGFVNQKTDFPFFVIIFDDASTDATTEIIRQYASDYPEFICAYIALNNSYGDARRKDMYRDIYAREFNGKYVAWCEGDDCWVDKNKLQIQVDFMDAHPEYAFTMHKSIRYNYITECFGLYSYRKDEEDLTATELVCRDTRLATASLIYRSEFEIMPDFFYNNGIGDYPRILYLMTKGKGFYFDRVMSIYRYGTDNSWTHTSYNSVEHQLMHLIKMHKLLTKFNDYSHGQYSAEIDFAFHRRVYSILGRYDLENRDLVDDIEKLYKKESYSDLSKDALIDLIRQRDVEGHCTERVLNAISGYKHVVMWGAGDGARRLAAQFKNDGISYDGHIFEYMSEKKSIIKEGRAFMIDEYDLDKKDTIVVVSCYMSLLTSEGKDTLITHGFRNYIFPYVMDMGFQSCPDSY